MQKQIADPVGSNDASIFEALKKLFGSLAGIIIVCFIKQVFYYDEI